jgi:hypothetical protein
MQFRRSPSGLSLFYLVHRAPILFGLITDTFEGGLESLSNEDSRSESETVDYQKQPNRDAWISPTQDRQMTSTEDLFLGTLHLLV